MRPFSDLLDEMRHTPLDSRTADRLLSGAVAPEDAPPELTAIAALVGASEQATTTDLAREAETVTAMVSRIRSTGALVPASLQERRDKPMKKFLKLKLAAITVGGLLVVTTGLALAGALPDAAQEGFANAAEAVGFDSIPHPDHPDADSSSNSEGAGEGEAGAAAEGADGEEVSGAATDDSTSGVDKAGEVTDATPAEDNAQVPESIPPAAAETGQEASEDGTGTAGDASETGAEQSESGQERRP